MECVTGLLYVAWRQRLFGGKCTYALEILTEPSQVSLSTALQVLPGWTSGFSRLFFPNPHLPSPAGNTREKFNDLSRATSWFSSLGERNEWNALMCRQTTALCVLETPDTWRNECLDNQVDCKDRSTAAHLGYATWELYQYSFRTEMDVY